MWGKGLWASTGLDAHSGGVRFLGEEPGELLRMERNLLFVSVRLTAAPPLLRPDTGEDQRDTGAHRGGHGERP